MNIVKYLIFLLSLFFLTDLNLNADLTSIPKEKDPFKELEVNLSGASPMLMYTVRRVQENCLPEGGSEIECDFKKPKAKEGHLLNKLGARSETYMIFKILEGLSQVKRQIKKLSTGCYVKPSADLAGRTIISILKNKVAQHKLSACQSTCLAACVTSTLVRWAKCAPTAPDVGEIIKKGSGNCLDIAVVMQEVNNAIGNKTKTVKYNNVLTDITLADRSAIRSFTEGFVMGAVPAVGLFNLGPGHYGNAIELENKEYYFDPMFDYSWGYRGSFNRPYYSCAFHPNSYDGTADNQDANQADLNK